MLGKAILSIDKDRTVCVKLQMIAEKYGIESEFSFVNGIDYNNDPIPETRTCEKLGIAHIDGLVNKIQSSSWLLGN